MMVSCSAIVATRTLSELVTKGFPRYCQGIYITLLIISTTCTYQWVQMLWM